MKKIFLVTIITLFSLNHLIGQGNDKNEFSKIKLGVNIGPNYNSFRGGTFAEEYKSKINFFVGLSIEYRIKENFSLLANLNYDVKSGEFTTYSFFSANIGFVKTENNTTFEYLNIPILIRYYIDSKNIFFINAGGFYNHLFNVLNESKSDVIIDNGIDTDSIDFNYLFNKNDFGVVLGIGSAIQLNNKNSLLFELRNDLGLIDIAEYGLISPFKTNTIKLIVNWSFTL